MAERITLASFDLDTNNLKKSFDDLNGVYFDLKKQQEELKNKTKETAKQIVESQKDTTKSAEEKKAETERLIAVQKEQFKSEQLLAVQMGTVRKEINQTTTQLRAYQDAEGKTASLINLGNKALEAQINNKNDARAANKALNDVANQLNPSIAEEAELLKQLNAKIDENTDFIKGNSSETAKQAMNIGNYSSALSTVDGVLAKFGINAQEARTVITGFASTVSDVKDGVSNFTNTLVSSTKSTLGFKTASQLAQQTTQAQAVATNASTTAVQANVTATQAQATATNTANVATRASTLSLKAFAVALLSTGIGAVVLALGSLITYLTTTQKGIDAVTSVTRPLAAVFESLIGVAQVLGEKLVNTFSNPKKALSELADFIGNNLINRVKAFGVILDGVVNLDFKKLSNGLLQTVTGLENVTDKVKQASNETTKFFSDAYKKGQEIDRLQKDIEKSTLKYNEAQKEVNKTIEEQKLISKDTSKSFAEREIAARRIIAITKENGEAEAKITDKRIEKLKIEQSLNDTSREGEQELIDLENDRQASLDKGVKAEIEGLEVIASAKVQAKAQEKALADKAIEEALTRSRAEINLFVAQQGFKKKSLEEELAFNQDLYDKEIADLELQLKNKKIKQVEFETSVLKLKNDLSKSIAEITTENAQLELDSVIQKNGEILGLERYLSEEQLKIKKQALADNLVAEQEFQRLKFENGLQNEQQYNDAVSKLQGENRKANEQLDIERKASETEKKLIDLENEKIIQEENFIAQAEILRQQNEIKKQQELEMAESTGADVNLIKQKYAELDKQIEATKQQNKVQLASQAFGNLAAIFGQESKAGKAAAIAQTTIDTFQSATSAFKSLAGIPIVGPALGGVAAGVAVKAGLDNVKKITATKEPSIQQPQQPPRFYASGVIGLRGAGNGTSDSIRANLSAGESVINAQSTSMFARELSAINQAGGGVGINGSSNILAQKEINNNVSNSQMVEMIANAVAIGAEAGASKGTQSGMVGLSDNRKVMSDAKF